MSAMRLACRPCGQTFNASVPMPMAECAEALMVERCPRCDAGSSFLFLAPDPKPTCTEKEKPDADRA